MIRGHVALVRLLQAFMEGSMLPWGKVRFINDKDEDGRIIYDDRQVEIAFDAGGQTVEVVIRAPSEERVEDVDPLPLGRLAARFADGTVIKGPIDQAVWERIVAALDRPGNGSVSHG